ncbi:voltage-dependent anion channel [Trametes punicea]|nr:voltage-dependent anion channel [Trametes punicea]
MGTGAVYVTLSGLKEHADDLTHVETFFYFLNMSLFLLNITTLAIQLFVFPMQAIRPVKDPVKGIFVPLVVLSFATIIIGTIKYAVPSGYVRPGFIYALFWVYVSLSITVYFPMLMVWFNQSHDLTTFTPAWAFLMFPMMLVGVVAFHVLDVLPASEERAIGVLLAGYVFQGLGFFVSSFYICIYIIRIMATGFLNGHQANGAFVAVGPPGFTALALMKLGENAAEIARAGEIWYAASVTSGLMLFGLAVFLFVFGILMYWVKVHKHLSEILGCWALTFPNVGWISTIWVLCDVFKPNGFYSWHLIMTILMCIAWLALFVLTVYAFIKARFFLAGSEDVIQDSLESKVLILCRSPRHSYNKEAQGQVSFPLEPSD